MRQEDYSNWFCPVIKPLMLRESFDERKSCNQDGAGYVGRRLEISKRFNTVSVVPLDSFS
jgi:hypothetical protein